MAVCRLLLIEDDYDEAAYIERQCCPDPGGAAIDVVSNATAAEEALQDAEYDLIICDLALPADSRRLEPETGQGLRLFELIGEQSQGTPVIILSGHADLHMMQRFVKAGRQADLYGTRTEEPLVRFFDKEDLPDCIDAVRSHIARTEGLDRLELHGDATDDLALSDCRAVRIYGRRTGASAALVEPLAGGLSDSRTLKVALKDSAGDSTGTVVIKLGDLRRVTREARRYEQLAARLPVGLGAHILYVVQAGAGRRGALVYQLADEHSQSLFSLLQRGESAALRATDRLTERLQAWVADAPEVPRTLIDLRRPLIADLALRNAHVPIPLERDVDLVVREAMAHGDLHGLNILVNHRGEPTLIDYGEVRRANAALDPVTLELSVVYHPAMAGRLGGWPTEDQARSWPDLDTYCGGCPVEDFVRKCRSWAYAVSSGEREVLATAYAYSMRQMKYAEATRPVALAVAASAYATLTA